MKDSIEEMIAIYKKKITYLDELHNQATDNLSKVRVAAKKSTYESVIQDLKLMIKDHEEDCA
jgi:prefoldin subunit 5